jgi:hypothetical protein
MTAQRPHLIVSESVEKQPILIIDKIGIIGETLAEKLKDQFFIVLVTEKEIKIHGNIVHVHYGKKIPRIPDENYSVIITIYHGEKSTLGMLPSVAKKANETSAKLLLITSLYCADKKLQELLSQNLYEKTIQVIYGEVFGNDDLDRNLLTDYIHQARTSQKIEIPGNGLQKSYPVLFEDVCDAIISLIFTPGKKAKTILILPKHGFTQLGIARAFQKVDPLIKINFKKEKNKEIEYDLPQSGEYFFQSYELEKKLKKIDLSKKSQPTKKPHIRKQIKLTRKASSLFLILLFFLLPLFMELLLLIGGGIFLTESVKKAQDSNLQSAQKYNLLAKVSFSTAMFIAQNISGINPVLLIQKEPIIQKAQIGQSLAEAESGILESVSLIKDIYEDKSLDSKNDLLQALAKIKNSLVILQELKAEGNLPTVIQEKINSFEQPLTLLGNTIDAFPDLLGFNQKRKYLILFQNNMELRPGGGFIGSYATVEVINGKTDKLKIHDVYDADGQLSAHIEPPFALRRYLGASHWFLRDSNFDVDFAANAQKAQNFLELETGEKVDGVIAIDTDFLKNLISVFGPLYVSDFKETITSDNFYLATETHAEKNFFPGSSQKKDFLRALYNALEIKILESKKINLGLFAQNLSEALQQKHLLIAFSNAETQAIFAASNLSGSLIDNRQKEENEFLDFLGVNEANLGLNKANFYLRRSIEQKVSIDASGSALETISITYENTSNKDSVFGGDYKNYLRFVLPQNATLEAVEVNGTTVPTAPAVTEANVYTKKGFIPPSQLEVEKTQEEGKTLYGFLTIIPKSTSQKISLTYSLPNVIDPAVPVFGYNLYLFKQPGTGSDPYSFSIVYPSSFQPIQIPTGMSDVGGKLVYTTKLSEDKNLILKFSKK